MRLCFGKRTGVRMGASGSNRRNSDAYFRQLSLQRKHGVIGEINVSSNLPVTVFKKNEKWTNNFKLFFRQWFEITINSSFMSNCRTKQLIKNAILNNQFLGDLDESRIEKLISVMYPEQVRANTRIIHEGEVGE